MIVGGRGIAGLLLVIGLVYGVLPVRAYAYLDPGTGSFVIQLLIAGVLGGLLALKLFWGKIKSLFKGSLMRRGEHDEAER